MPSSNNISSPRSVSPTHIASETAPLVERLATTLKEAGAYLDRGEKRSNVTAVQLLKDLGQQVEAVAQHVPSEAAAPVLKQAVSTVLRFADRKLAMTTQRGRWLDTLKTAVAASAQHGGLEHFGELAPTYAYAFDQKCQRALSKWIQSGAEPLGQLSNLAELQQRFAHSTRVLDGMDKKNFAWVSDANLRGVTQQPQIDTPHIAGHQGRSDAVNVLSLGENVAQPHSESAEAFSQMQEERAPGKALNKNRRLKDNVAMRWFSYLNRGNAAQGKVADAGVLALKVTGLGAKATLFAKFSLAAGVALGAVAVGLVSAAQIQRSAQRRGLVRDLLNFKPNEGPQSHWYDGKFYGQAFGLQVKPSQKETSENNTLDLTVFNTGIGSEAFHRDNGDISAEHPTEAWEIVNTEIRDSLGEEKFGAVTADLLEGMLAAGVHQAWSKPEDLEMTAMAYVPRQMKKAAQHAGLLDKPAPQPTRRSVFEELRAKVVAGEAPELPPKHANAKFEVRGVPVEKVERLIMAQDKEPVLMDLRHRTQAERLSESHKACTKFYRGLGGQLGYDDKDALGGVQQLDHWRKRLTAAELLSKRGYGQDDYGQTYYINDKFAGLDDVHAFAKALKAEDHEQEAVGKLFETLQANMKASGYVVT